jgi:hypothetical protein
MTLLSDNVTMDAEFFWNLVKGLIKLQNTTQEWLASQVGVSVGTLKNWIYYKRFPDGYQSYKIAVALNTTVEYLVTGKESNASSNEEQSLLTKWRNLTDTAKDTVIMIINGFLDKSKNSEQHIS